MQKVLKFPNNFLWGTAIAAHQVEGNNVYNDWWDWEQKNSKIEKSGIACDHYHLFDKDLALAKNYLNNNAIRISIEWSRVFPEKNRANKNEISHYKEVLKSIKRLKLTSVVTLHHFTNPLWFSKLGGWEKENNGKYFQEFVKLCVKEFGEMVDWWLVFNEPNVYVGEGYLKGTWVPQKKNLFLTAKVFINLAKTHKEAYKIIKKSYPETKVGSCVNFTAFKLNNILSRMAVNIYQRLAELSFFYLTRNFFDYIGVNYYQAITSEDFLEEDLTDMGWKIYPKGIYEVVTNVWNRFQKPILITENGIADAKDTKRQKYLTDHLVWLHKAIENGAQVKGYFHWSLIDNFEWAQGRKMRFGLIKTDYKTLKRIPRKSASSYAKIARENAVII